MLIKFISGKKRASRAAAYLLAAVDSAGLPRPGVEVLRGDPRLVAKVADGLPFRHKYTSAVISWAPEDKPGDAEISRTLDEFERLAWAGLEPSRRCWSAVLHREAGEGCHVHVLSARVDLGTGKSLNIAPPGWRRDFDPLRDWLNAAHGWARPDDPARARDLQPGFRACEAARRRRLGLEPPVPGLRTAVHGYLAEQVAHGDIADRAGIVAALETLGLQVPRQGRSYITVLEPQSGERIRLKGQIYERDFNAAEIGGPDPVAAGPGPQAAADGGGAAAAALQCAVERVRERRAEWNERRYGAAGPGICGPVADVEPDASELLAPGPCDGPEPLDRHLRRRLGADALPVPADPGEGGADRGAAPEPGAAGAGRGGPDPAPGSGGRLLPGGAARHEPDPGQDARRPAGMDHWQQLRFDHDGNDRIGKAVARLLEQAVEAVRAGAEAALRASRRLAEAARRLERERAGLDRCVSEAGPSLERSLKRLLQQRRPAELPDPHPDPFPPLDPPPDFLDF